MSRGTTLLSAFQRTLFQVHPKIDLHPGNGWRNRRTYWQISCVQIAAPEGFSVFARAPALTSSGFADIERKTYSFPSTLLLLVLSHNLNKIAIITRPLHKRAVRVQSVARSRYVPAASVELQKHISPHHWQTPQKVLALFLLAPLPCGRS